MDNHQSVPKSSKDVTTQDSMDYLFFPLRSEAINFLVKATNDVNVALTTGPADCNPMYEICIGSSQNMRSFIRKNKSILATEVNTPKIVSGDEFRSFWITFYDNVIAVGLNEDPLPILLWFDPELFTVSHFGVRTCCGATGSWEIQDSWDGWNVPSSSPPRNGRWVPASGGEVPPNAVIGGYDNELLYVGRAYHNGSIVPGKIHPSHCVCYVSWGGKEYSNTEYEVLCDCNGHWVATIGDEIPANAIPGGVSEVSDEPLYIGRTRHSNTITCGKVQPSLSRCYIPYGGREYAVPGYEIFVGSEDV